MGRNPIPLRALALLPVLALMWGTSWPLFAFAVQEVSGWTFRAVACVLAGGLLLLAARLRGLPLAIPRRWWPTVAAAACVYLALWNVATVYAAVLIPSGQAAVLGFTMPLWAALLAWLVLGERPGRRMALAITFGALAVALLMVPGWHAYARAPLGFGLGLLAGIGWAAGTLILKQGQVRVPALVLTGWQLLIAAVPTAAGALLLGDRHWFVPSWTSVLAIGWIALGPMGVGNVAWFALVGLVPVNVAALASILVPIVAMISGAIVHGEPLGPLQWAAMLSCVAGLSLTLLPARRGG